MRVLTLRAAAHASAPISASACSSQNRMSISRYIVVAVVRCSWACWRLPAPVQLAEAEVAVGDEGAHAEVGGQRHRGPVVGFGRRHVGMVMVRGNLVKESKGV